MKSRRESLRILGGASLLAGQQSDGQPLRKKLTLQIKNPEARVIDPRMPTPSTLGNEFPPSVVTAGGRRWLFIGSNHSVAVPIPPDTHILKDPQCATRSPAIFSIGGIVHEIRLGRLPVLYDIPPEQYWRHTYCGTFNVDVMPADGAYPEWIFSINHCENKNLSWKCKYTKFFTTNSINPADEATPETTSGNWTGRFRDYQPAYFGFVSMSYAPVTADTHWGAELFHHDQGAILWPQTSFMTPDGKAVAPGFKHPHNHPSSLIAEDPKDGKKYLYVFAVICSTRDDCANMICAARSPIQKRGLPGTFLNLYQREYTEPSLAADMSGGIEVLRTRKGGKASAIHPSTHGQMNRFFVARLKRSGLFLSVESYREGKWSQLALRLSEDLRTWTDRVVVPHTSSDPSVSRTERAEYGLLYPKFLSHDGTSHYEIDENERFYIIATKPGELVYRELEIRI